MMEPNGICLGVLRRKCSAAVLALLLAGCVQADAGQVKTETRYGEAIPLGKGTARTYIQVREGAPMEIGVDLTESALEGLPNPEGAGGHLVHGNTTFETVPQLPADNPTPYRHVLLNWNPGGHEPAGIYDLPHLDFHFFTIDNEVRLAISHGDPAFQEKAERTPDPDFVPEGYILPEPLAFPGMGVHWIHPTSAELNGSVFKHTFIFGSWDGELTFAEPMVTKAFLESRETAEARVPHAHRYRVAGRYPSAYRIGWDTQSRSHRIALTGLEQRH